MSKQEAFGAALKRALDSKQAYAIIDAHPEIHGTTWMSGSCPVLAAALMRWWPGFELAHLEDRDTGTIHHVLVYHNGLYFDGDGASTEEDLLWRWQEEEGLAEPNIIEGDPGYVEDFACPLGAIEGTHALLVNKLGRPSWWGFGDTRKLKKLYHVTSGSRKRRILRQGLRPRVERRGFLAQGGDEPRIYLFEDLDTAKDAAMNWLGDELPEDESLVIFEVETPGPLYGDPELAGAVYVTHPLPPSRLRVVLEEAPEENPSIYRNQHKLKARLLR